MAQETKLRLASIVGRYVRFSVSGGVLRYRAPRDALTPADRAWITEHKAEIVALLAGPDEETAVRIWWDDPNDPEIAPVIWIPPSSECHAPRACSRLGPCKYRVAGQPCDQRTVKDEAA